MRTSRLEIFDHDVRSLRKPSHESELQKLFIFIPVFLLVRGEKNYSEGT